MDRYKYLRIEYPEKGFLKVVHQDAKCFQDYFMATNGLKISSCDQPEVRLRESTLFIRGMSEDRNALATHFNSAWTLENIVLINQAVLEYNQHMLREED